MNALLGIDIGTSGTKCLAIDTAGKTLAAADADLSGLRPQAAVERARPGRLVAGHDRRGPRRDGQGPAEGRPT